MAACKIEMMKWYAVFFALFFTVPAWSEVRLPSVLGSNMVLQQQSQVAIWGWANPYEKVNVTTSWDGKTYSCIGSDNAKWQVMVQTPVAGGPYSISINNIELTNVLIGEVWICSGQSNMEMSGKPVKNELPHALNKNIRFFHISKTTAVAPQDNCPGNWTICDSNTLKTFSAVAYFFGKNLQKELNVPIGLIAASWGGTSAEVWTPDSIVTADPVLKKSATYIAPSGQCPHLPGYAYNGMIAPVTNFTIAGVIWYQGENNTVMPYTYSQLFTSMIDAWRDAWHKELPFYYVQIAPYNYKAKNTGALLREAQIKSAQHPHTGMVVITDLVDNVYDVHPANKQDVGLRLSNYALAETYHKTGFAYKSPIFTSMEVKNNKAVLSFDQPIMIKGKAVSELMMAGDDKVFYPAMASVKGNILIATCKDVKKPVAVRFGFSDTARGNLFSAAGLPVTPFRTDDWKIEIN
jgi:sialate O-acetylesterase